MKKSSFGAKTSLRSSAHFGSRRTFSLTRCLGLGVAAILLSEQGALADAGWVGSVSNDYGNTANWSQNPSGQNVFINNTPGAFPIPVISANVTAFTPNDIFVGNDVNSVGRLDHRAGNASTGNSNWLYVGTNNGNGTYNLANTATSGAGISGYAQGSGSMNVGNNVGGGRIYVGGFAGNGGTGVINMNTMGTLTTTNTDIGMIMGEGGGRGTFNMESGTFTNAGDVWVGNAANVTSVFNQTDGAFSTAKTLVVGQAGGGTYNLSGGTANIGDQIFVSNTNGQTATINQTGGTVTSASYVGVGRFGNGTYNVSAGTLNASTNGGFLTLGGGGGSNGTVNVSGTGQVNSTRDGGGIVVGEGWTGTGTATGILNVSGNGVVNTGTSVTGGILLGSQNQDGHMGAGTVNLNGGTIQTAYIRKGAGTGTFNFNGGVLQATASDNPGAGMGQYTFLTGLNSASVLEGGAKINTNTFNVTVGQALLHGGAAATDGGLLKSGTGALTLTAANTYTGPTSVTGGTLLLASGGSINGSQTVSVSVGALTLQGTAQLADSGSLNLASGTTLTLGAAGNELINTLFVNNAPVAAGTYTAAQLTTQYGGSGVTFASGGETLTVAVPEPATWAAGLLLCGAAGYGQRRRVAGWLRAMCAV